MRSVQKGKKLSEGMILYFILILLQSIVYYKYYGALKKTSVVKMKVFFWFSQTSICTIFGLTDFFK